MKKTRIISTLMALAIVAAPGFGLNSNNQANHVRYKTTATAAAKQTGWVQKNGYWYYYNVNGNVVRNQWLTIDGKRYHFDKAGRMNTKWYTENNKTYYLGNDGAMRTGNQQINGKWYYFFPSSGIMVIGCTYMTNPDGSNLRWYNYDSNGVWIESDSNGAAYYLECDHRLYNAMDTNQKSNKMIPGKEVVYLKKKKDSKTGILWGAINYEGRLKGYIIIQKANGALNKISGNIGTCVDAIDNKYNK